MSFSVPRRPRNGARRRRAWRPCDLIGYETLEIRLAPAGGVLTSTISPLDAATTSATTTTLTASNQAPASSEPVTLTATVAQSTSGVSAPTGMVEFSDNGALIGTTELNAGQAILTVSDLSIGQNTITAQYGGDSNNDGSLSSQLILVVGTSNEQFLNQAYLAIFHQQIGSSQLATLDQQLTNGASRESVVSSLVRTPAATIATVQNDFEAYLGREGTTREVSNAISTGLSTGMGVKAVILSSPQFIQANAGGTLDGYLNALATAVIGTSFTPAVQTYLTNLVAHGTSLIKVAEQVLLSGPGKGALITSTFESILGRDPTSSEILSFAGLPGQGINLAAMQISLLSSDEFFTKATSPADAATTTTLTSSPNPSSLGESVTFTATVAPNTTGAGMPTGSVVFLDGTVTLGTVALTDGVATLSITTLPAGSTGITAQYQGDTNFSGSTSTAVTQVVTSANPSTTSLTSSDSTAVFGQSVTFTATVTGTGGTPTGTVDFLDGRSPLGSGILDDTGVAIFTTSALTLGANSITSQYEGDANFAVSTSSASPVSVAQSSTATAISGAPNPSTSGESVTFTATVTAVSPGAGTPTGTVEVLQWAQRLWARVRSTAPAQPPSPRLRYRLACFRLRPSTTAIPTSLPARRPI